MKTLTIRGVPDSIHGALKRSAQLNRRSLNQEIIANLEKVGDEGYAEEQRLISARARVKEATEKIDSVRLRMTRFMTTAEIDTAISEGRR